MKRILCDIVIGVTSFVVDLLAIENLCMRQEPVTKNPWIIGAIVMGMLALVCVFAISTADAVTSIERRIKKSRYNRSK